MLSRILDTVCIGILQHHLNNPWHWLRESDLVVDVVTRVRDSLPTRMVAARLGGPGFDRRLMNASDTPRMVQRVRTEVKVARSEKEANENEDNDSPKNNKDRIDVCVLSDDHIVDIFVHEKGARDVVLKVMERDIVGLLETKLYSDLYIRDGYCGWLDDLVKLSKVAADSVRGVLYLDTALPLESVAVNYRQKRRESSLLRVEEKLPPWPIVEGKSFVVRYKDQLNIARVINFSPIDTPLTAGLYFWALALRKSSNWKPDFTSGISTLLSMAEVIPCCWQVSLGA